MTEGPLFDIWSTEGVKVRSGVQGYEAECFMELSEGEVEWAVEEHGRCDTLGFIAVPAGSEKPMPKWAKGFE